MATHLDTASSTQSDSLVDVLPHVDAASEAESVQNVWSNDCESSASQTSPSFAQEASLHPAVDSSTTTGANQTTELEDEEYGEFVEASTDPLKRPIYDTTEQEDETLELLNSKSAPKWETDTYVGMGIVEPVRAGIDMTTRKVKKMAHWKRNDSRASAIMAEHRRKRSQHAGGVGVFYASATAPVKAESNQYLLVSMVATSDSNMNGVMRPVRFTESAIDEMVETERTVWGP
jgi:hypothetical protein